MNWEEFYLIASRAMPLLLKGALVTVEVSSLGILIGLIGGVIIGVLNCDRLRLPIIAQIISFFVTIVRGTPIFVQLLIVYFAFPETFGIDLSPFAAGVLTLGVNSTAYLSETIRGGINAVPDGQWEASHVLGYTKLQTLRFIILPQAFKSVLPAITNEFAALIKDSSILMVIGVPELLKSSKDIVARELQPMEIYLMAAILYLIMTTFLAQLTKLWEKKLK